MNSRLRKIKKLIKNFKYIANLENEIDIYLRTGDEWDLKRINYRHLNPDKLRKVKETAEYVRKVIIKETEKNDFIGETVCKHFCIKGKSVTSISISCYISRTTVYREIDKLVLILYVIYLKNKKFEKSVNYLINELQNII